MLLPDAHVTLAEFKGVVPLAGAAKDAHCERAIMAATRIADEYMRRRTVFRAPTEDDDSIVAQVALTGSTQTLAAAGQPGSGGRIIVVTINDPDRGLHAGTLTITGTVAGVAGVTETFDIGSGVSRLYGVKFFTAVSAREITGMAGAGAGDTIKVGTSLGYVEHHTPGRSDLSVLYPCEGPIQNVNTVHEDVARVYGSDTLLVADTDYLVSKGQDVIYRLPSGNVSYSGWSPADFATAQPQRRAWPVAWRSVRLALSAGYAGAAGVPWGIKDVTLRLAARIYLEEVNQRQDVSSRSDALGTITRFGPSALTEFMRDQLSPYRRHHTTGERDFDLEAA